jgi:hypothetical protein
MNKQSEQIGQMNDKLSKLKIATNAPDDSKIARLMQNGREIDSKPPLPIMAGPIVPPHILIAHVEQEVIKLEAGRNNKTQLQTLTTILAPITHGIAPHLTSLHPITIKEAIMRVNTIQTGRVLYVKTVNKSYRIVGTSLLVEDANNDLIILTVYNFVHPEEDPQLVFPCGTHIAILEPYLRFAQDNPNMPVGIRTDNPQTIIIFDRYIHVYIHMYYIHLF